MKIYIITRHDVYNYGASLQAYALQQFLSGINYEVEIINYLPNYDSDHYGFSWYIASDSPYYQACRDSFLLRFIYCLRRALISYKTLNRKMAFDKFKRNFLNLTKPYTRKELFDSPPKGDVFIAGSDQIWNNKTVVGKDDVYYLAFTTEQSKRISYAASFGSATLGEKDEKLLKMINRFNSVSVRESSGVDILKLVGVASVRVCDPVFLLDREAWQIFAKRDIVNKPYLLVYNLGEEDLCIKRHAELIAKRKHLEIVSINSPNKLSYADINISNAGPVEFVTVIKNAEFVLSNSFHGTSFAIIFEKNFFSYTYVNRAASMRMINLLIEVGLEDRFDVDDVDKYFENDIKYQATLLVLNDIIYDSKRWLSQQLND